MTNFSVLKQYYPSLALELEKQDENEFTQEDFEVQRCPSGNPVLKIKGFYIHSPRDPVRESQRQVESGSFRNDDGPIIIIGFGLGYVAEAAVLAAPGRPVIIVEKRREVLKLALELRNLEAFLLNNRIAFVLGGKGDQIIGALSLFEKKEAVIFRNRALINLDKDWYEEVERGIQSWVSRTDVNKATLKRFGRRWVTNLSHNLTTIRDLPGINRLENILKNSDIPVFLAAAGPSLDEIGPLIKEIFQRCVIVAVDTCLRFILRMGINPDFVVSIDPQYLNFRHLDRAFAPNSTLIAESAVYPPCLRHTFKAVYLCGSLFPLGRFIEDRLDPKGTIGAGGSVATAAWDFARVLGASSIWIGGLDLSFPNLKTHFRGALFEDRAFVKSFRFSPIETWSVKALRDNQPFPAKNGLGGVVLTDQRLSLYASWFENRFNLFPDIKNYSLSGEGIAIKSLEIIRKEDLLALAPRRNEIDSLLQKVFAKVDDEFALGEIERAGKYEKALNTLLQGLGDIKTVAEESADLADTFYRRFRKGMTKAGDEDRILKKLESANRSITSSPVKEVAGFLLPDKEELEKKLSNEQNPLLKHLEFSRHFYLALAEAAGSNQKVLTQL